MQTKIDINEVIQFEQKVSRLMARLESNRKIQKAIKNDPKLQVVYDQVADHLNIV